MGFFKKLSRKKILLIGVGLLMVSLLFYIREMNSRKFYAEYEKQLKERIIHGSEYRNKQIYNEYYSDRWEDFYQIDKYMSTAESIINNSYDVDSMMVMLKKALEYCDELIYKDIEEYEVPLELKPEHEQFIEGIVYIRDGIITLYSAACEYRDGNYSLDMVRESVTTYHSLIEIGLSHIGESFDSIKSKID